MKKLTKSEYLRALKKGLKIKATKNGHYSIAEPYKKQKQEVKMAKFSENYEVENDGGVSMKIKPLLNQRNHTVVWLTFVQNNLCFPLTLMSA